MEVSATAKYIRVSPRKMELLAKSIKSMAPKQATQVLRLMNQSGALPLGKVILSALANAKNSNLAEDELGFKKIEVLPGSAMKRFRAVSRGMAHSYKKRMSHVKVVLTTATKSKVKPNQISDSKV